MPMATYTFPRRPPVGQSIDPARRNAVRCRGSGPGSRHSCPAGGDTRAFPRGSPLRYRNPTAIRAVGVSTAMSDDRVTVSTTLPRSLYERYVECTERTATDEEELLEALVQDHVDLHESIRTYTGGGGDDGESSREARTKRLFEVPPPIGRILGFDLAAVEPGRAEVTFDAGPRHANPMGTLHGGVICDVGDAAMGIAFASTLDEGESFTTLELDVKYLKPVWSADLTATGEVTKRGRTTGLVECEVTDEEGSLVAKLSSVCLVLRGDDARGR